MLILLIVSLIVLIFIVLSRYIQIGNRGSLTGIIFRKVISFFTYILRDYQFEILNEYKKINKNTKWKMREGKYRGFNIKKIDIDSLDASLISPTKKTGKIILQLHGGGYEIDLPNNSLYFAPKYLKFLKDVEILTINYRVAPEYKYPAALQDSVKAYRWLLDNGYEAQNIVIAGDSAGGGLALSTIMYLRDNNIEVPLAVVTMSAWTDLSNSQKSFCNNFKIDPVFGNSKESIIFVSRYAEDMDKKNPYISPLYGDYKEFPDMLMQVGSYEMLLDDTVNLANKAKKAGVNVTQTTYNGMFHIFQKFNWILPESSKAWKEVRNFLYRKFYDKK